MSQTDDERPATSSPFPVHQQLLDDRAQQLNDAPRAGDESFESLWAQWEEADVRVTAKDGRKLWCVHMDGDGITRVVFEDRKALLRSTYTLYELLEYGADGVGTCAGQFTSLVLDAHTGNLFYQSSDSEFSTVWLNNGSCLERIVTADGEDVYFITNQGGLWRTRAYNVKFNATNDTITYENEDGSQLIVILCHRTMSDSQ
jgi:hypothetical protein